MLSGLNGPPTSGIGQTALNMLMDWFHDEEVLRGWEVLGGLPAQKFIAARDQAWDTYDVLVTATRLIENPRLLSVVVNKIHSMSGRDHEDIRAGLVAQAAEMQYELGRMIH